MGNFRHHRQRLGMVQRLLPGRLLQAVARRESAWAERRAEQSAAWWGMEIQRGELPLRLSLQRKPRVFRCLFRLRHLRFSLRQKRLIVRTSPIHASLKTALQLAE